MKNQNVYFLEKGAILIENNGSLKKSLWKSNLKRNNLYILDYRNALMKRTKKQNINIESNNGYRETTQGLPFLFLDNYICIRNYWSPWTKFKELRYPSTLQELIFHFVTTDLRLTFSLPAPNPPWALYNSCIACKCFQFRSSVCCYPVESPSATI